MSGLVAGRFQLLRALGSGGMGEVSLALDRTTGAECALKRLRADKAASETLRQEFAALIAVRHPAIVSVYEFGVDFDGTPFFTMEYVPGLPADRALAPGRWAPIAHVAARVLAGLEALHRGGVVHGDLKPSNILIVPAGEAGAIPAGVRLVDFGLAALP